MIKPRNLTKWQKAELNTRGNKDRTYEDVMKEYQKLGGLPYEDDKETPKEITIIGKKFKTRSESKNKEENGNKTRTGTETSGNRTVAKRTKSSKNKARKVPKSKRSSSK